MRDLAQILGLILVVACSSEQAATNQGMGSTTGAGSTSGGASDVGTDSASGAGSGGASDVGTDSASGAGSGGSSAAGSQCAINTLPGDAPFIDFGTVGQAWSLIDVPNDNPIDGSVLVERTSIGDSTSGYQSIDLVTTDGRRHVIEVKSTTVVATKLPRGAKLWLEAFEVAVPSNPVASPRRRMQMALRTEQNGPLLLAALDGFTPSGDTWLGIPVTTSPWCSDKTWFTSSVVGDEQCSITHEYYGVAIGASPAVELTPGTAAQVTLGSEDYDAALRHAGMSSYDQSCAPSDWEPQVAVGLSIAARNWDSLVSRVNTAESELPICVLGTDAPPFAVKMDKVTSAQLPLNPQQSDSIESAVTPVATADGNLEFTVPNLGKLSMSGLSAESRAVLLAQGKWISLDATSVDFTDFVIRDKLLGKVLAASFSGTAEEAEAWVARWDRLGLTFTLEPRCDWTHVDCDGSGTLQTLSAYDVVWGDTPDTRVSSHASALVTATDGKFTAWVGVSPRCNGTSTVRATFLAAP